MPWRTEEKSGMESQRDRKTYKVALLVALATVLQISESLIPYPIPGLRLGLANMLTLTALVVLGFRSALEVAVLRTTLSSFIIGTFMSPTFILSFSAAVISTLVMGFFYWLSGLHERYRFSIIGISIIGAFTHNMVQLYLAYLLLVRHGGVFVFFPWLAYGAVATGWLVGVVTGGVCRRLADSPGQKTLQAIQAESAAPVLRHYVAGDSLLHRTPPQVKISVIVALAVAVLFFGEFWLYLGLFCLAGVASLASGTPFGYLLSRARRASFLVGVAFLLPVFFNPGTHVVGSLGPIIITTEGLGGGALFAARILLLIIASCLLVRTTSPEEMTRGLVKVLSPIRHFGVSDERIATILSLSWTAVPHLLATARQAIRAANLKNAKNVRNLVPLLSDLIAALYVATEPDNELWKRPRPAEEKEPTGHASIRKELAGGVTT
jgi:heptaprenyl diphosphate synthase